MVFEVIEGLLARAIRMDEIRERKRRCCMKLRSYKLSFIFAGWADRVFYSDNGSTAIEIAIKMAFRKYAKDHDLIGSEPFPDLWVSNSLSCFSPALIPSRSLVS